MALTGFLQNWQGQERNTNSHFGQNQGHQEDTGLARSFIQILKSCLNQGCHDDDVATKVLEHVQQWQPGQRDTVSSKRQKVSYYDTQPQRQFVLQKKKYVQTRLECDFHA